MILAFVLFWAVLSTLCLGIYSAAWLSRELIFPILARSFIVPKGGR